MHQALMLCQSISETALEEAVKEIPKSIKKQLLKKLSGYVVDPNSMQKTFSMPSTTDWFPQKQTGSL